jgi:hypothetical protein
MLTHHRHSLVTAPLLFRQGLQADAAKRWRHGEKAAADLSLPQPKSAKAAKIRVGPANDQAVLVMLRCQ